VLHTRIKLRDVQDDPKAKTPLCGGFAEPSDGLEPSTPSLPWGLGDSRSQAAATVSARLNCSWVSPFPPDATSRVRLAPRMLHRGPRSIVGSSRRQLGVLHFSSRAAVQCESAACFVGYQHASLSPEIREPMQCFRGEFVKPLLSSVVGVATLVATTVALAAPNTTATARLVRVTSPVSPGSYATLVAHVVPARRCRITVYYKSGPSVAQGLYPKRPRYGRVSWTWMVGTNTTAGRWPIQVSCGTAGAFRTHFRVR
jgi:hypothetical protein